MLSVKKMEGCSLKLFTEFLEYAKSKRDEGLGFPDLLEDFFSEELEQRGGQADKALS